MTAIITTHQQQQRFKLIKKPYISEKSTLLSDKHNQFVFKVHIDANKAHIKQAVEFLFKVEVEAVRVLNVKPKIRRFKQKEGRLKAWKKAYVSLKKGYDIDFTGTK